MNQPSSTIDVSPAPDQIASPDRREADFEQDATVIPATDIGPFQTLNNRRIPALNKPRLTYQEAAGRVIEHGKGLGSERFPLSGLRVADNLIFAGGRTLVLDRQGLRRLCNHVHAPADYVEALPPKLRDPLLSHHLRNLGGGRLNDSNSHIIYRDGTFVNLGRADLQRLQPREVLDAVRDGFGTAAASFQAAEPEIRDEAFRLDLVSLDIAAEVLKGDIVRAGLRVEYSYIDEHATTIQAYVERLICLNGMIQRECLGSRKTPRTRRLNADKEDAASQQIEQIRRMAQDVQKTLGLKLDAIRKLAGERAELGQIKKFLRQARMHSASLERQLEHAWEEEGKEETAFGFFNALTRLATHGSRRDALRPKESPLSDRQRTMLSRLAGIYATRSQHICPRCFSMTG